MAVLFQRLDEKVDSEIDEDEVRGEVVRLYDDRIRITVNGAEKHLKFPKMLSFMTVTSAYPTATSLSGLMSYWNLKMTWLYLSSLSTGALRITR